METSFDDFARSVGLVDRLLVLVPHPDDETLGCGGLLALAADAGMDVTVVLVTDGGASHPASRQWPRPRLAAQRRAELSAALHVLGIGKPPVCLDMPDAGTEDLPPHAVGKAVETVSAIIGAERPDIVLTTWRREPHCDHRFAFRLAQRAIHRAQSAARLLEYLVWTPLVGAADDQPQKDESRSLLLDISDVRLRKLSALECHRSQLGRLIDDDPDGFRLTRDDIEAMTGPCERYEHAW